jgi:hypothetical protein
MTLQNLVQPGDGLITQRLAGDPSLLGSFETICRLLVTVSPRRYLVPEVWGPGRGRFAISFSLLGKAGRLQNSNDIIRDNPE